MLVSTSSTARGINSSRGKPQFREASCAWVATSLAERRRRTRVRGIISFFSNDRRPTVGRVRNGRFESWSGVRQRPQTEDQSDHVLRRGRALRVYRSRPDLNGGLPLTFTIIHDY